MPWRQGAGDLIISEPERKADAAESPGSAALYIASFAEELARLAKGHNLEVLAYLLDMARLEADHISKHWAGPAGRRSRGKD